MVPRIAAIVDWLRRLAALRSDFLVENLALRQQLAILTARRPRTRMRAADQVFWVALRRFWPRWREALVINQPETVVRWHREGSRKYWAWKSRRRCAGRPSTTAEILPWSAVWPLRTRPVARRTVLHVRVTKHPTGRSIIQQPREAFPFDSAPRYLVFDKDKKYGADVLAVIEQMGFRRKKITPYSPWQNGAAERWVETVRRDRLDHVIVLDERHLQRLLSELVAYDHDDRTHLGLFKGTPSMRATASKPHRDAEIVGHSRVAGLHHRHEWRQAA